MKTYGFFDKSEGFLYVIKKDPDDPLFQSSANELRLKEAVKDARWWIYHEDDVYVKEFKFSKPSFNGTIDVTAILGDDTEYEFEIYETTEY